MIYAETRMDFNARCPTPAADRELGGLRAIVTSYLLRVLPLAIALAVPAIVGCGMAATPQPPSLYLPKPITDLTATRSGDSVTLHWTTPKETVDRLAIKTPVRLKICRQTAQRPSQLRSASQTGSTGTSCDAPVTTISTAPGKPALYTGTIPADLAAGPLHPVHYQVFGLSRNGRVGEPSNDAVILAGELPAPVVGLSAAVIEQGVLFHWLPATNLPAQTQLQLRRTTLGPINEAPPRPKKTSSPAKAARRPFAAPAAPTEQTLIVKFSTNAAPFTDPGTALDSTAIFGDRYQYTAQYVIQQHAEGRDLQATSAPSAPIALSVLDTFPPGSPARLAAIVVSAAMTPTNAPEVDLSWSANTEPDFAQYRVYRRDLTTSSAAIQIAPASASRPLVAPTFRDTAVVPGHQYSYSVTALDQSGNQSAPSHEVRVTIPPPPS